MDQTPAPQNDQKTILVVDNDAGVLAFVSGFLASKLQGSHCRQRRSSPPGIQRLQGRDTSSVDGLRNAGKVRRRYAHAGTIQTYLKERSNREGTDV
jgi:hypothetical protein